MPAERYTVRVSKDYLVFCAGHFITYDGENCERLHGHNYRVAVEVDGELDANQYVFDFIALKQHTKAITDTLDHRMLLPTESKLIDVEEAMKASVHVRYGERRWTFPREGLRVVADREYHGGIAGPVYRAAIAPIAAEGAEL